MKIYEYLVRMAQGFLAQNGDDQIRKVQKRNYDFYHQEFCEVAREHANKGNLDISSDVRYAVLSCVHTRINTLELRCRLGMLTRDEFCSHTGYDTSGNGCMDKLEVRRRAQLHVEELIGEFEPLMTKRKKLLNI